MCEQTFLVMNYNKSQVKFNKWPIVKCCENLYIKDDSRLWCPCQERWPDPLFTLRLEQTVTGIFFFMVMVMQWELSSNALGYRSFDPIRQWLIQSELGWGDWITVNMAHNGDENCSLIQKQTKWNGCSYHMLHSHFRIVFFYPPPVTFCLCPVI